MNQVQTEKVERLCMCFLADSDRQSSAIFGPHVTCVPINSNVIFSKQHFNKSFSARHFANMVDMDMELLGLALMNHHCVSLSIMKNWGPSTIWEISLHEPSLWLNSHYWCPSHASQVLHLIGSPTEKGVGAEVHRQAYHSASACRNARFLLRG